MQYTQSIDKLIDQQYLKFDYFQQKRYAIYDSDCSIVTIKIVSRRSNLKKTTLLWIIKTCVNQLDFSAVSGILFFICVMFDCPYNVCLVQNLNQRVFIFAQICYCCLRLISPTSKLNFHLFRVLIDNNKHKKTASKTTRFWLLSFKVNNRT